MKYKNIFVKKDCLFIFIGLFVMLCVGTLYDYQISEAIYNPNSLFGIIFASFGQLPAMLCMAIGGILLIITAKTHKTVGKILCYIFGVLLQIFAVFAIAMDPVLYIENMNIILSLFIGIVFVILCDYFIMKYTKDIDVKELNKMIIILLGVMLCEIILINVLKVPWARPRMRLIEIGRAHV